MNTLLYIIASTLIKLLQMLPLRGVARLGRWGGGLAYRIDARHRKVAIDNLTQCFGDEKSREQIRELAHENFRRLGENYACGIKTAAMTWEELKPHCEFVGAEKLQPPGSTNPPASRVVAVGHFGNFELYARFGQFVPAFQCATTYRGLRQPALDKLMLKMREKSGCHYFERRTGASALKHAITSKGLILGLLADQHAGDRGLRLPFFGRECSTSAAPAVFALRYHCPLHTAICYRVGLAKWRVEVGPEIPIMFRGEPRSVEDISRDVNVAFEQAIERDPVNWFWVHKRWKANKFRGGSDTKQGHVAERRTIPIADMEAEP